MQNINLPDDDICPVCGTKGFSVYRDIKSRLSGIPDGLDRAAFVHVRVERCSDCGLFRSIPLSEPPDSIAMYSEDSICFEASASKLAAGTSTVCSTDELSILTVPPPARLLDVGCGAGQFLLRGRALGYDVTGVEVDPRAVAFCHDELDLNVRSGGMEAVADNELFDVISALGVLEHIATPDLFLSSMSRHLTASGEILIGVPNTASLNRIISRMGFHDWDMFLEPGHLYNYDIKCLSRLAQRNGLRCKSWMTATLTIRGKIPLFPMRNAALELRLKTATDNSPALQRAYTAGLRVLDRVRSGDMLFATFAREET